MRWIFLFVRSDWKVHDGLFVQTAYLCAQLDDLKSVEDKNLFKQHKPSHIYIHIFQSRLRGHLHEVRIILSTGSTRKRDFDMQDLTQHLLSHLLLFGKLFPTSASDKLSSEGSLSEGTKSTDHFHTSSKLSF